MIIKFVFDKQSSFSDILAGTGLEYLLAYIFEKVGQWMVQKWLTKHDLAHLCKQGISFVNMSC